MERMGELVLHHYPTSPFSEKVRLVLGMKRMAWRSVTVPMIMPKPDVVALTGGYRRTPFMQIGADVYCDSALMCRVIDRLAPEPPLYPASSARPGRDRRPVGRLDACSGPRCRTRCSRPASPHIFAGAPPEYAEGVRRRPRGDDAGAAPRAAARRRRRARTSYLAPARGDARRRPRRSCSARCRRSPTSRRRSRSGSCAARRRSRRMLDALSDASSPGSSASPRSATATPTPMASDEAIALAARRRRHAPTRGRRRRRLRRRRRGHASTPPTTPTTRSPARLVGLDADEVVDRARRRARRPRPRPLSRASASTSRPSRRRVA